MSLDNFLLPKDTKVFLLYERGTAESYEDSYKITQTITSFKKYGYDCSLKPYPTSHQIVNDPYKEIGVHPLNTNNLNTLEHKQWYGFASLIKKSRVLDKPYIITFAGNRLLSHLSLYKHETICRFPSSDTFYRNYIIHPPSGVKFYKTIKEMIIDFDLHRFMELSSLCTTVNSDFKNKNAY